MMMIPFRIMHIAFPVLVLICPAPMESKKVIAPPLEAMYALDAAIKAADVTIVALYNPPSETNFGGGLLTGSQSACKAACNAFAEAVEAVAANPLV